MAVNKVEVRYLGSHKIQIRDGKHKLHVNQADLRDLIAQLQSILNELTSSHVDNSQQTHGLIQQ